MSDPQPASQQIGDGATVLGDLPPENVGSVIGPYKLLQQIGQGGFGVVYMAEQEKPVRQVVALKIIKPGMDTGQVIARFESERQSSSNQPSQYSPFMNGPAGRSFFHVGEGTLRFAQTEADDGGELGEGCRAGLLLLRRRCRAAIG